MDLLFCFTFLASPWLNCVGRNFFFDWVKNKIQITNTGSINKRGKDVFCFFNMRFHFFTPSLQKHSCPNEKAKCYLPTNGDLFVPRFKKLQFDCFRPQQESNSVHANENSKTCAEVLRQSLCFGFFKISSWTPIPFLSSNFSNKCKVMHHSQKTSSAGL